MSAPDPSAAAAAAAERLERLERLERQQALTVEALRHVLRGDWPAARIHVDALDPARAGTWREVPFPPAPLELQPASVPPPAPAEPPPLLWRPSPHFQTGRRGVAAPSVVVCHITDGGDPSGWFASPRSQVSAHFTVLRDGRVLQHVRLADTAWANGVVTASRLPPWCPRGLNPNTYTVSVEHEGRPRQDAGEGFGCLTAAQTRASGDLLRWLAAEVPTLAAWTAHATFDPVNRRHCPGPLFPWAALGAALGRPLPTPIATEP